MKRWGLDLVGGIVPPLPVAGLSVDRYRLRMHEGELATVTVGSGHDRRRYFLLADGKRWVPVLEHAHNIAPRRQDKPPRAPGRRDTASMCQARTSPGILRVVLGLLRASRKGVLARVDWAGAERRAAGIGARRFPTRRQRRAAAA